MTKRQLIREKALEVIAKEPKGIRWAELLRRVREALPEMEPNTVQGSLYNLDSVEPTKVYKPARGVWRHVQYKETEAEPDIAATEAPSSTGTLSLVKEEDFYAPFADWLLNELEECTKVISVGGNKFKDKWGTPDVIGIRKSKPGDIIPFPIEIVSAEIKTDSNQLITAFGQSCSYRLFSNKSYLVIPRDASEADIARLDTLARIFGIGLILFDPNSPEKPQFEIRVRASRHEADMFYVNKNMKLVADELFT
jgi:hypothetical protein